MRRLIRTLLVCILAATFLAACSNSFSPVEPSALSLSIFGYIDASADTQWIRIMPIRSVVPTSPDGLAPTVTLKTPATGEMIELRDSVFRFLPPNSQVGSGGIFLHNFWTTEKIDPGATYQFTATMDGDAPSEAMVKIPPDYGNDA